MGHCIQAFISTKENLDKIHKQYGCSKVIKLPHGFYMLPLTNDLYDSIEENEKPELSDNEFMFLTPKLGGLIIEHSQGKGIVYLETEYFGGDGTQCAVFVKEDIVLIEPNHDENAINQALKLLGVEVKEKHDEFDEIYLGWFRDNDDWIEQPVYGKRPKFEQAVKCNSSNN